VTERLIESLQYSGIVMRKCWLAARSLPMVISAGLFRIKMLIKPTILISPYWFAIRSALWNVSLSMPPILHHLRSVCRSFPMPHLELTIFMPDVLQNNSRGLHLFPIDTPPLSGGVNRICFGMPYQCQC